MKPAENPITRTIAISAVLVALTGATADAALTGHRYLRGHHHRYTHEGFLKHTRSGQRVDYGTIGLHHGTATGGPVGGGSTQP